MLFFRKPTIVGELVATKRTLHRTKLLAELGLAAAITHPTSRRFLTRLAVEAREGGLDLAYGHRRRVAAYRALLLSRPVEFWEGLELAESGEDVRDPEAARIAREIVHGEGNAYEAPPLWSGPMNIDGPLPYQVRRTEGQ